MSQPIFRKGVGRKVAFAVIIFLGAYIAWVAAWSRQGVKLEPVRLGIDACHHCGMIVSDIRYAVSVLDTDAQGHTVTRHFDDPGCFQEFATKFPHRHWVGVAHDYKTGKEIPLDQANFVKSGQETPMGSGVVVELDRPGS